MAPARLRIPRARKFVFYSSNAKKKRKKYIKATKIQKTKHSGKRSNENQREQQPQGLQTKRD